MFFKNSIIVTILYIFLINLIKIGYISAEEQINIAGIWNTEFRGIEKNCQNGEKNGAKKGNFTFEVEQKGDSIFAIFEDGKTTNIVNGKIKEALVEIIVKGSTDENCEVKTTLKGQIVGKNQIKGAYMGNSLNCETCEWKGMFSVDIIR